MYRLLQPLAQWLFRPWALLAMLSFTTAAQPISTSWMTDPNHPPVSVRFVLTGQIDSDTQQLAGYLDVKLEQPWKTYWRSPGEGGGSTGDQLARFDKSGHCRLALAISATFLCSGNRNAGLPRGYHLSDNLART